MKRQLSADEIKQVELGILLELDRICAEHGLTYMLAYGTCLGALRHQGFIPWDDDIDVFMPRDDYERLYDLFAHGLESRYRLVSHRDGSSIYPIFKLVDPATESYETFVGKAHPMGLWVDIFPLERVGAGHEKQLASLVRKRNRIGLARSFAVADTSVASTEAIKLVKKIVCPFARALFKVDDLNRRLERCALDLPAATGALPSAPREEGRVCDFLDECDVYDASVFFPVQKTLFEGHELPIPNRAEEYLERAYGDWKTPPPEDKRLLHFPEAYAVEKE